MARRSWGCPHRRTTCHLLEALVSLCLLLTPTIGWAAGGEPEAEPAGGAVDAGAYGGSLNLDFETATQEGPGGAPDGWFAGGTGYDATLDLDVVHSGAQSLRLASRNDPDPQSDQRSQRGGGFGVATRKVPVAPARGKRLRLSGYLKTDEVTGDGAGLWMRVDGPNRSVLAFDNMEGRRVTGTTDWTRYEIVLPVDESAVAIYLGALLPGDGTAWVDSLSLEVLDPLPGATTTPARSKPDPAPQAVVDEIRKHAERLASAEPDHGLADLEPLAKLVGEARVVALGEATHGTREFFQLKHRVFEYLVERLGFTALAIEANWPEARAIDRYVQGGDGDPKDLLQGIYFWTWDTEEVLDLIEWMRRYNAEPGHEHAVHFVGFDMQTPVVAARETLAYLRQVDPGLADADEELLRSLADEKTWGEILRRSPAEVSAVREQLRDLVARFDERRDDWIERTGAKRFTVARQQAVVTRQAAELQAVSAEGGFQGAEFRDAAMAANVQWILDTRFPGSRIMVWTHNLHASRAAQARGIEPMGAHLASSLGDDYVALGFVFDRGSFQAMDWTEGRNRPGGVREQTVGPSPPGFLGAVFARTGLPLFALDLRALDGTAAGRWLAVPRPMRSIGAVFSGEPAMIVPAVLPKLFDGVLFVAETHRARPLGR